MKKKTIFMLFLLSLLVLSSCTTGPRVVLQTGRTTDYFQGTEGITVKFLDQAPPREVFENSEFDVQLLVHNKGAYDLIEPFRVSMNLAFDPSKVILQPLQGSSIEEESAALSLFEGFFQIQSTTTNQVRGHFVLDGKNQYWIDGEQKYLNLGRFKAREIVGNFQTNTASFIVQMCYPYQTTFAQEICVDTDTEGVGQREEICQQRDYSFSGGQGAPVAITAIETQMVPRGVYVQPQFTIHIESKGGGVVSYRDGESTTYDTEACNQIIDENDLNKISAKVMLGGDELDCLPNEVILKGGEAKIQCQLTQDKILGVSSNYVSVLQVLLGYQYSEAFREDLVILKSAGTPFEDRQVEEPIECFQWQTLDPETDTCVNTCDYLAENKRDFASFKKIEDAMNIKLPEGIDKDYLWSQVSCNYRTASLCKDNPNHCILENNLCMPDDFCGIPSCISDNTAPRISNQERVGDDVYQFFCTDPDDNNNLAKTCGCRNEAKYGWIPKDETCGEYTGSYSSTSAGDTSLIFGIQHQIRGISDEANQDKKLCIQVEDKFGLTHEITVRNPSR